VDRLVLVPVLVLVLPALALLAAARPVADRLVLVRQGAVPPALRAPAPVLPAVRRLVRSAPAPSVFPVTTGIRTAVPRLRSETAMATSEHSILTM
jgi:hypothetical protein